MFSRDHSVREVTASHDSHDRPDPQRESGSFVSGFDHHATANGGSNGDALDLVADTRCLTDIRL
jgi:hypothetical protein